MKVGYVKKRNLFRGVKKIFKTPDFTCSVDPKILPEKTQHLLSAYVDAQLDGRNAAKLFPDVHKALAKFPAFAQEHKELYEILDLDRRGELEKPPNTPKFDFSYLTEKERSL